MARTERPLDSGDSPLLRMAADLRGLREKAGSPVYRELARRANYSVAALSGAAAGRKLPSLALTLAYVSACGGDVTEWTRRWHEVAGSYAELPPAEDGNAPYVGLAAFRTEDAGRFFGREKLVAQLRSQVAEHRFVVVTGPSGSGKSSLLRAGLLHHTEGPATVFSPGAHPLEECAARLAALTEGSANAVHAALVEDARGLHRTASQAFADREALIVVDQFEEVFSLCRGEEERTRFLDALSIAAGTANSRVRVVIGVRADFYGHCVERPELVGALRAAQVVVGPMTAEELRSAITQPAVQAGCRVENSLAARVIADAVGQPGALPLVSHALLETWRRRQGNRLTLAGYEEAGGISEAVSRTAETVYAAFDPEQREAARHLFGRLVALGEGTEDTRRRLALGELDLGESGTVLEHLARARLVTVDQDCVQITHEALIRCWPRLREWLDQDRASLRLHRQLTEATGVWESVGRDAGALYRGTRLDTARELVSARLTARERVFLNASLAAEARRTRRRRLLLALLVLLLVLSTGTTIYAVRADNAITHQRDTALSQKVAADAVALRQTNPALAAQLSLAAYQLSPTREARDGLLSVMGVALAGHSHIVSSVAFAPTGALVATGSFDHTARLWDITDPYRPTTLAVLTGHRDNVTAVAFSADGHRLATASRDQTVRLWDVTDPRHPVQVGVLTGHTDTVFSVAFGADGHTLATASYDRTARLWNLDTNQQVSVLTSHRLSVKPVAFGGRLLATGSDDRTARLWDVLDPAHPVELSVVAGHRDIVDATAINGRLLATGSNDHTVGLWDISDPRNPAQLAVLNTHTDIVSSVAFAGNTLASSGYDHTTRLWDLTSPTHPVELAVLTGHTGGINATAFSPNGQLLATASDDHTAQLWDTDLVRVTARACAAANPVISRDDWERYLPGLSYQPPCQGS